MSVDGNWLGKEELSKDSVDRIKGVMSLLKISSQSGLLSKKQRGNSSKLAHRIFLSKVREGGGEVVSEMLTGDCKPLEVERNLHG